MSYLNEDLQEKIAALEAENARLKLEVSTETVIHYAPDLERIAELEGLLSTDTAEWKSAAFQKIKALEAEVARITKENNSLANALSDYDDKLASFQELLEAARKLMGCASWEIKSFDYTQHTTQEACYRLSEFLRIIAKIEREEANDLPMQRLDRKH